MSRETRRQLIHMAVGGFGLLFHWLDAGQAALLAGVAVLTNFVVLPLFKLDRSFLRENEPYLSGVKLYPLVVLGLIGLFHDRLPLAAGGWAILAVGDSVSNLFGRRYGKTKLPWNPEKSWAGTLAFVAFSIPAAFLFIWWAQAGAIHKTIPLGRIAGMAAAASLMGAIFESDRLPIDDNIKIGFAVGLTLALYGVL